MQFKQSPQKLAVLALKRYCPLNKATMDNLLGGSDKSYAQKMNQKKRKIKATQIRAQINEKLSESGERQKLKELLCARLIESGWRDQLKTKCKEIIQNKGLEKITISQLVEEITPFARSTVPENIKSELLSHLREFINDQCLK